MKTKSHFTMTVTLLGKVDGELVVKGKMASFTLMVKTARYAMPFVVVIDTTKIPIKTVSFFFKKGTTLLVEGFYKNVTDENLGKDENIVFASNINYLGEKFIISEAIIRINALIASEEPVQTRYGWKFKVVVPLKGKKMRFTVFTQRTETLKYLKKNRHVFISGNYRQLPNPRNPQVYKRHIYEHQLMFLGVNFDEFKDQNPRKTELEEETNEKNLVEENNLDEISVSLEDY